MSVDEQQIIDLLKVASAYDSRKPDHAAVLAWREAAGRARWTFPAALDAIHAHYAESAERIMPGHVTARLRAEVRRAFDQDVESALGLPTLSGLALGSATSSLSVWVTVSWSGPVSEA